MITITPATLVNLTDVQSIGRQTFFETFAESNTPGDMQRYLEEAFAAPKLTAELADGNSAFFLAKNESETIGYLKVNFGQAQTELIEEQGMEIERIYVLQAWQGKEVGQLLYEKALELARQKQVNYVWLGVWEKNPRAIRFYEKNGFVAFDKHIFRLGSDEQTDILMRLEV